MTFKDKVCILDAFLTGKDWKTVVHNWNCQPQYQTPEQWLFMSDAYYLSDGGYSRIICKKPPNLPQLALSNVSLEKVKERWGQCGELIDLVEHELQMTALDLEEEEGEE